MLTEYTMLQRVLIWLVISLIFIVLTWIFSLIEERKNKK